MAESETETEYKQGFMGRVAEARIALGWKQWQMAKALGIPQDQYKQYEGRSLMPHRYIWAFCMFARIDLEWLLTGEGKRAQREPPPFTPDIAPAARAKRRKARAKKVA